MPQKEKFDRSKPHVNIGTIGQVDHSKTTLTAAITTRLARKEGITSMEWDESEKAIEEETDGITINTPKGDR